MFLWPNSKSRREYALFFFLLPGLAVVDLINGILEYFYNYNFVSSAARIILLFLVLYVYFKKMYTHVFIITMLWMVVVLALLLSWGIHYDLMVISELRRIIYLFYPVVLYYVVCQFDCIIDKETVARLAVYSGLIVSSSIIFSFITKTGNLSYGDYGFGTKSFYIAGNSLGLLLSVSLSFAYYLLLKNKLKIISLINVGVVMLGIFLLGSRGAWGAALIISSISLFAVAVGRDFSLTYKSIIIIIFTAVTFVMAPKVIEVIQSSAFIEDRINTILDGNVDVRAKHVGPALELIKERSTLENIFGTGFSEFSARYSAVSLKESSKDRGILVENDPVDAVGSYGFLFGGLLISFYLYCWFRVLSSLLLNKDLFSLFLFASVTIIIVHSLLAGHLFYDLQVSLVFVSIVAYKISRDKKYVKNRVKYHKAACYSVV